MTSFQLSAQVKLGEGLEADKTVHNFGDIKLDSGPVSCTFTLTNTSDKPIVIYQVVSSCGCTDVEWTKEPILPGKKGKISATYSNDNNVQVKRVVDAHTTKYDFYKVSYHDIDFDELTLI